MQTSNIVPMHRCVCGEAGTAREIELSSDSGEVGKFFACDKCVAATFGHLDRARPIFDAMIAAGVPNEIANDAMTYLHGRWDTANVG